MNFFDVYLKRMNVGGTTRQERIKTSEENEFEKIILKRTKYKGYIYQINDTETEKMIDCSLQPSTNNENKIIFTLCVSNKAPNIETGDIIYTYQTIKNDSDKKNWIVLNKENDITKGYKTYKIICLDNYINITDEYGETKYTVPVKFVTATNVFLQDYFSHSKTILGYREPQDTRILITKDYNFLKKDTYFNYKDRGWEIQGIDNLSINNVAYITISERLIKQEEPISSKEIKVGKDTNFFLNGR